MPARVNLVCSKSRHTISILITTVVQGIQEIDFSHCLWKVASKSSKLWVSYTICLKHKWPEIKSCSSAIQPGAPRKCLPITIILREVLAQFSFSISWRKKSTVEKSLFCWHRKCCRDKIPSEHWNWVIKNNERPRTSGTEASSYQPLLVTCLATVGNSVSFCLTLFP